MTETDDVRRCEVDVAIVGAGPAGIAAAVHAAGAGRRVAVLDAAPGLGGQIWRHRRRESLPRAGQGAGSIASIGRVRS